MTDKASNGGNPRGLTAGKVRAWIEEAQPGARLIYFHGTYAAAGRPDVNELLLHEQERGTINLVQDFRARDLSGHDYLAIRTTRPVFATPPVRKPRTMSEQARDEMVGAFRGSGR